MIHIMITQHLEGQYSLLPFPPYTLQHFSLPDLVLVLQGISLGHSLRLAQLGQVDWPSPPRGVARLKLKPPLIPSSGRFGGAL